MEDDRKTIVYRYPIFNQAIQDGAKLVVREGQFAVFQSEGKMSEPFTPGTFTLNSRTKAVTSFFDSIKYQLNYPYKGDVFFVSSRQFVDQKWGTPGPIPMSDAQFGMVNVRAFGNFSYRIVNPVQFLRELVGNMGVFSTEEVNGQLKRKLSSAFIDSLGEANIPLLKLASKYLDLGEELCKRMSPEFEERFGIKITDFVIERVSMPKEVEKMMNKVTSMNMAGDMNRFSQFQAANAMEQMASRPGGGSNTAMDAGMGLAMGNMMGNMMGGGGQQHAPQQHAPAAPPPPPAGVTYHYNGASGSGQYSAQDVARMIAGNRQGAHNVWAQGFSGWKSWKEVPEIANLVPPEQPPPMAAEETFHYNGPEGASQLTTSQVAEKMKSNPSGRHLVWKQGFSGWKPAEEVPEIAAAMQSGPPPIPGAPPPPPM
jgi:membrane protease subunit (stomatin/prohibitin family)